MPERGTARHHRGQRRGPPGDRVDGQRPEVDHDLRRHRRRGQQEQAGDEQQHGPPAARQRTDAAGRATVAARDRRSRPTRAPSGRGPAASRGHVRPWPARVPTRRRRACAAVRSSGHLSGRLELGAQAPERAREARLHRARSHAERRRPSRPPTARTGSGTRSRGDRGSRNFSSAATAPAASSRSAPRSRGTGPRPPGRDRGRPQHESFRRRVDRTRLRASFETMRRSHGRNGAPAGTGRARSTPSRRPPAQRPPPLPPGERPATRRGYAMPWYRDTSSLVRMDVSILGEVDELRVLQWSALHGTLARSHLRHPYTSTAPGFPAPAEDERGGRSPPQAARFPLLRTPARERDDAGQQARQLHRHDELRRGRRADLLQRLQVLQAHRVRVDDLRDLVDLRRARARSPRRAGSRPAGRPRRSGWRPASCPRRSARRPCCPRRR